jgi:hypothetical protein
MTVEKCIGTKLTACTGGDTGAGNKHNILFSLELPLQQFKSFLARLGEELV